MRDSLGLPELRKSPTITEKKDEILDDSPRETSKGVNTAKTIRTSNGSTRGTKKLQMFLDIVEQIRDGEVAPTTNKDFEPLNQLDETSQELVYGVQRYLDMLEHDPSFNDLLNNSVDDFIIEKKIL